MAQKAAAEIAEMDGIDEAYVTLVSKIGSPINEPLLKGVRISGDLKLDEKLQSTIDSVLDYWLESGEDLVEKFVKGKLTLF
jgi:S-adenosylmethionine synthetase